MIQNAHQNANQKSQAKYLKDYQAPLFSIESLNLIFNLNPEDNKKPEDQYALVTAKSRIKKLDKNINYLELAGGDLELVSLLINQTPWEDYEFMGSHLIIENLEKLAHLNYFDLEITTKIYPARNTQLSGLYQTNHNYCTQCESEGFRRITYFLDRPDVMTVYTTKIIADTKSCPVLLSNGNLINSGVLEQDPSKHWALWEDPFKKPSYLFALFAGDLGCLKDSFITMSQRKINLEIYVPQKDLPRAHHAMESLKQAMRWDEEVYGREYDLNTYMIVAVPDFNMGAMENKGLNIFNSKFVLADPKTATDLDYQQIQAIIGHEYFHNWTGNRITCRDWFQLSLKEGLTVFRDQEFSGDFHSRGVKRIQDVKIIRSSQFAEDASPMAHPIRPDSYIEMNNFYTVTVYNKGAEVIRMMRTLAEKEAIHGKDGFARGMELYFERFDGMAVTCDDFRQAIADGAQIDLDQFSLWYSQAGTPEVKIEESYDPVLKQLKLKISQHCPKTPGQAHKLPLHIPIKTALLNSVSGKLMSVKFQGEVKTEHLIELRKSHEVFIFEEVSEQPIPSLLRNFSAPVKLNYPMTPANLGFLFAHDNDLFNRWDAGQKFATHCIENLISNLLDDDPLEINPHFSQAILKIVKDDFLDPGFISEAISLPSESTLGEEMKIILVDEIHQARKVLLTHLSETLRSVLLEKYVNLSQIINQTSGQRALKNTCLNLLMASPTPEIIHLAQTQFEHAENMTDQMAALTALVHQEDKNIRDSALEYFYQAWSEDPIIMGKWLQVQALSPYTTIQEIEKLMTHESFDLKNPNKVSALLVAFCQNPKVFHNPNAEAYILIAETVKKLNFINPQVASRLVRGLMNWRRYDQNRQELMRQALESILSTPHLSQDVFEIVSKSLD